MSSVVRIGVFICECGDNISDVVDVEGVLKKANLIDGVVFSANESYLCSKPSISRVRNIVKEKKLNRVILACCSPKMHGETFRSNLEEEGLNSQFMEIVNIREQCSWVHKGDKVGATQKAIDLIRSAIERSKKSIVFESKTMDVVPSVLVIGGGIAGINVALSVAEYGLKTFLVEKEPSIGGHMIKYPKVFPTLDCSQCILTPKMASVSQNQNIKLFTCADIVDIYGVPGDFIVKILLKPRGIDVEKCVGCGNCASVCPVEAIDDYNENLSKRNAVYMPFPQAVPSVYTIDFQACKKCGICAKTCPRGIIDLDDKGKTIELKVGSIVLATGFDLYDMTTLPQYGYGKYPNIITSLQMERILDVNGPTGSELIIPATKKKIETAAFILCAGSRDAQVGVPYCSRVCCLYAIKEAELLKERGVDTWIHYIDIRAPGRRYEEFYKSAQEKGIRFVKGKVMEIVPEADKMLVRSEDMTLNAIIENTVDLVVLCPPMIVNKETVRLAESLKIPIDEDKFILERHPKLDPLATKRDGIFACGTVLGPKDIQYTTAEAEGTAIKVINFLTKARSLKPDKAFIRDESLCDGCGICVKICPEGAISIKEGKAQINNIVCNGCGACIPECPYEALDQQGLLDDQLIAQIGGLLKFSDAKTKILAFVEETVVSTAVDLAGLSRISYPSSIRIIQLPSMSRLKLKHLLYAYAYGADGIMVLESPEKEGPFGKAHKISEERMKKYMRDLGKSNVHRIRLRFSRVFVPDWRKLEMLFNIYDEIIRDKGHIKSEVRKQLLEKLGDTPLELT